MSSNKLHKLPVTLTDGSVIVIEATTLDPHAVDQADQEREVVGGAYSIDSVITGIRSFASQIGEVMAQSGADKVSIQFGCEIGLESGTLVAILGKVGTKTAMNVTLEWTRPASPA